MTVCYIGIGSNLGDRKKTIGSAIKKIKALKKTRILRVSKLIETMPVGGPAAQPKYLNAAAKLDTAISPLKLLKEFKKIEKELGRVKTVRNAPRTIDLDILLYGDSIINTKELTIPHPRMFDRDFVIKPLLEVI